MFAHRFPLRLTAASVMLGAATAAAVLVAVSPIARAITTTQASGESSPTPPPPPTPTPTNATIGLNPTAGDSTVGITVTGQLFLPNENITLYWDDPSRVAASTQTDSNGAFKVVVKPFPGDQPGVHHLYASVQPNPHADFTLEGPPTPTPPASPTPSDSPSPSSSPSPTDSPSPSPTPSAAAPAPITGIDIIPRPPFVFLPIIGALGLLGVIAYWALSGTRRNRSSALPASVVHRSVRPDYGAPFGGPVAPPTAAAPPPSEPAPPVEPPAAEATPPVEPQAVEPPPPVEPSAAQPVEPPPPSGPPELPGAPDAPPDLPEPSD